MSELETARAGVFLSLLALTLTWVLLRNSDTTPTDAQARAVAVCASTHGAICETPPSSSAVAARKADIAYLGEVEVTAARLPTPLGRLVVSASRLSNDPRVRLAEAAAEIEHQSVVVR